MVRKTQGLTDFAIVGRTYDKVVSASVQNRDHFGVRWIDSPAYGGLEHGGDTARILIIRISDSILPVFHLATLVIFLIRWFTSCVERGKITSLTYCFSVLPSPLPVKQKTCLS